MAIKSTNWSKGTFPSTGYTRGSVPSTPWIRGSVNSTDYEPQSDSALLLQDGISLLLAQDGAFGLGLQG